MGQFHAKAPMLQQGTNGVAQDSVPLGPFCHTALAPYEQTGVNDHELLLLPVTSGVTL